MFQRYHRGKPGDSPATLRPHLVNGVARKSSIQIIEYDKDHLHEREISSIEELKDVTPQRGIVWINMDGLGDVESLKQLGEMFNLHPLALEDVLNTGQRPKIEPFIDHLFIRIRQQRSVVSR
jgi:magnesium transporter